MSSLNLVEAEVLGKVEMILARDPQKGTMVSYPHRDIMWTVDHDVSPTPYGGLAIVLIGRKESLLDSYRYLISHDVSIKNAYQHPATIHPHSPRHSSHSPVPLHNSGGQIHPPVSPQPFSPHHSYAVPPSQSSMTGSLHYRPYPAQPVSTEELNAARFKPAEFNAKRLRVGSWEKKSYFAGDLKVKFLYVKKRMVWEILDVFGLTKIEILFKDITSLAVQQTPSEVCMIVDVAKLPFFYHGYPQKMKNTRWEHTSDMTGGQASVCRTHVLYLPKNALHSHMDKLVQSDTHMRNVTSYTATSPAQVPSQGMSPFPAVSPTQFTQTFTPANMTAHLKSTAQQPHGNPSSLLSEVAPMRASCKCTNGCGKSCACTKDLMWCDASCACRGGAGRWPNSSACGNPSNLKLTSCARLALLDPAKANGNSSPNSSPNGNNTKPASTRTPHGAYADPNKLFKLPCRCGSATLSDLVAEHECAECGAQFFYSFCFQCVVPVGAIWHCDVCGECRDSREFHCDGCGKCSYASPNNACRNCDQGSRGAWDRSDCVIC